MDPWPKAKDFSFFGGIGAINPLFIGIYDIYIYIIIKNSYIYIDITIYDIITFIPVVPHKAVAEVSKIGNL